MPFYEKGDVRIHYEEAGSGFPLLVIPGGGLNSTVAGLATHPFNPMDDFKGEYRCIPYDLEPVEAGTRTDCGGRDGAAQRVPPGAAGPLLQQQHHQLGPTALRPPA